MALAEQTLMWTKVAAIGQVVGAIATAAAVAASLWIVLSERKEHLRLSVGLRTIVGPLHDPYDVIAFMVTNVGLSAVRITGFGWSSGWSRWGPDWARKRYAIQLADDGDLIVQFPIDIQPSENRSMFLRLGSLVRENAADDGLFGPREVPMLGHRYPPLYGSAFTTRGPNRTVKVEPALKKAIIRTRDRWLAHAAQQ